MNTECLLMQHCIVKRKKKEENGRFQHNINCKL